MSKYEKLSSYKMSCEVSIVKNTENNKEYVNYSLPFGEYAIQLQEKQYNANEQKLLMNYLKEMSKKVVR